jgi:hypothetical protein
LKLADNSPVAAKDPVRPKGYVKETTNFVITDDLSVLPVNSTATIFQLWNKLDVQEPTDLKEQNVTLGPNEVINFVIFRCLLTNYLQRFGFMSGGF